MKQVVRLGALGCCLLLALVGVGADVVQAQQTYDAAVLRGLDKITARITTFEAPVGQEVAFGTLRILTFACRKRPPEEPPEVAVFLKISEHRPGDDLPTPMFTGWMFASSPALSALEHPVYDVWAIDCKMSSTEGSIPPSEKSAD
jgi:hypothetical protein